VCDGPEWTRLGKFQNIRNADEEINDASTCSVSSMHTFMLLSMRSEEVKYWTAAHLTGIFVRKL